MRPPGPGRAPWWWRRPRGQPDPGGGRVRVRARRAWLLPVAPARRRRAGGAGGEQRSARVDGAGARESAFIDLIARPAPAATVADRAADDDAPPRRELWWWALAAALALFLAEALAGSRGAARPAVAGGGA
ncbi:MAG: hypothetical protein M5U09_09215 [Gammaproteobacteria bacterium]|nr:hypothetical protein [Gammaproteobacteria bacterium]